MKEQNLETKPNNTQFLDDTPKKAYFAEIVESSLHEWTAQSWAWNEFPPFGSLVSTEYDDFTVLALVCQVSTGSMDPSRSPFPYQKTEAELLREQPQIFEFLKTTFTCLPVGYAKEGSISYQICPKPPKIHSFVGYVPDNLMKQYFTSDEFLYPLISLNRQETSLDDLLLAIMNQLFGIGLLTKPRVKSIIDAFSLTTGNDYRRLKTFLGRAQPVVNQIQS